MNYLPEMPYFERKSTWLCRLSPGLLLGVALFFPLSLLGAEQAAPQPESAVPQTQPTIPQPESAVPQTQSGIPQTRVSDRFDSMDVSRDYLSGKVTSFASYIDRFFGGDRHYQESNPSVFQMNLTRATGYAGTRNFNLEARLNLRLPVTEGRLRLLVETDPEKNVIDAPANGATVLPNKVDVPKSVAVATRLASTEEGAWHFHTDAGLKFPIPVRPFARSAGNYSVPLGEWRLTAAESVYWFNTLGVGETTSLNMERILTAQFLFRAASIATWLKDMHNLDMRQDLSFYHTLDDRTVLLYQATVSGLSKPGYQVTDSVLLVDYRYRLHQKWLFFDFSPQLHFPKALGYKASPAFNMRLEVLFDDSRSLFGNSR